METKLRRAARGIFFAAVAVLVLFRLYRQFIPAGIPPAVFVKNAAVVKSFYSPSGRRKATVSFDALSGGSGLNYRTWIYVEDLIRGKRVVAEGYSGEEVLDGSRAFPLQWIDDDSFWVRFRTGRYGGENETLTIELGACAPRWARPQKVPPPRH